MTKYLHFLVLVSDLLQFYVCLIFVKLYLTDSLLQDLYRTGGWAEGAGLIIIANGGGGRWGGGGQGEVTDPLLQWRVVRFQLVNFIQQTLKRKNINCVKPWWEKNSTSKSDFCDCDIESPSLTVLFSVSPASRLVRVWTSFLRVEHFAISCCRDFLLLLKSSSSCWLEDFSPTISCDREFTFFSFERRETFSSLIRVFNLLVCSLDGTTWDRASLSWVAWAIRKE